MDSRGKDKRASRVLLPMGSSSPNEHPMDDAVVDRATKAGAYIGSKKCATKVV